MKTGNTYNTAAPWIRRALNRNKNGGTVPRTKARDQRRRPVYNGKMYR